MLLHISRTFCALLIMLFSTALFAAEKNYIVTAPDGVRIAVQE